jgi:hypothetical protein
MVSYSQNVSYSKNGCDRSGTIVKSETMVHHRGRLPVPVEIGPNIRTSRAARLANKSRLEIRQPGIIGPSIAVDRQRMAAAIVGAIYQKAANAGGAHFCEGNLPRAGKRRHAPMIPPK